MTVCSVLCPCCSALLSALPALTVAPALPLSSHLSAQLPVDWCLLAAAGQLFTFDYSQLGFQRFGRPLFPIDEDAAFAPGASVAPGESVAARL